MNAARSLGNLAVAGLLASSIVACSSMGAKQSTGEYVDDSVISNTVRAKLLGDKDLNLTQIDVETFKGVVQLSGFVDNSAAKNRASQVAGSVSGVKQVRNNLIVK
jgi:osmotically-inducible protein OsmY